MQLYESHRLTPSLTGDLAKKQAGVEAHEQRDFLRTAKAVDTFAARVESALETASAGFAARLFLDTLIRLNPTLVTDLRLAEAGNVEAAARLDTAAPMIAKRLELIFAAQAKNEDQIREAASELYNLAIPNEDVRRLVDSMEIASSDFDEDVGDSVKSDAAQGQSRAIQN